MGSAPAKRAPAWLAPAGALCGGSLALAAALAALTGAREVGDDAPHLLELVRSPWILFGPPGESGLPATWQSFPPLLPPLFGLAVRPWLALAPDFWAIRLGALLWAVAALAATDRFAAALEMPEDRRRPALWLFALAPSTLAATALLPQEEAYVALFALAPVAAAAAGRYGLAAALLAAAVLAGKVFLAGLALPLAALAPRPLREGARLAAAVVLAEGGWLALQAARFGAVPLLGYEIDPATSVSAFALLADLGLSPGPEVTRALSGILTVAGIAGISWAARLHGLPLLPTAALCLLVPLLTLSIAMPPYFLWSLPLAALAIAGMEGRARRRAAAVVVAWGALAYACKVLSGVALAAASPRPGGKGAIAELAFAAVGRDFPFRTLRTALLGALLGLLAALLVLLWRGAPRSR
jgi:hypothetical protein